MHVSVMKQFGIRRAVTGLKHGYNGAEIGWAGGDG
jgi:hypothetical protein